MPHDLKIGESEIDELICARWGQARPNYLKKGENGDPTAGKKEQTCFGTGQEKARKRKHRRQYARQKPAKPA